MSENLLTQLWLSFYYVLRQSHLASGFRITKIKKTLYIYLSLKFRSGQTKLAQVVNFFNKFSYGKKFH